MFNFLGKFKQQVVEGFNSVHQRLVTLEAKVEALFEHTKQVATQDAAAVKTEVADAKPAEAAVAQAVAGTETPDAKQNP